MSDTFSILKQLFSAFPNTQVSEATVAVYLRLLRDIQPDDLQVAVDQAIATCKFMPTVAELRDTLHGLTAIGQLSWGEAWEDVQKEMRRIGSYGGPAFSNELTAAVVRSMGWKVLCASENPQTDRAQFRDMYNALAARRDSEQKLLPRAREWAGENRMIPIGRLLEGIVAQREVEP